MNILDNLVTQALTNHPEYAQLQVTIEKEIIHQDILKILSQHKILPKLTFIGGTCLRSCYNANRLSEDLDFTATSEFTESDFSVIKGALEKGLYQKYKLKTSVSLPTKDEGNIKTWKIKIETRPKEKYIPSQKIHLDICSVKSYERKAMPYINRYRLNGDNNGLIIYCQSIEEIYIDKIIAFAGRPNRIKYRDVWDIVWLHQEGVIPKMELLPKKLAERKVETSAFLSAVQKRTSQLSNDKSKAEYIHEMSRFLPQNQLEALHHPDYWNMVTNLVTSIANKMGAL